MTPSDDSIMSMMGDCSTEPPAIETRFERLCAACGKRFGLHSTHKPQKCPGTYGWEKTTFIEAEASPECPMGIEAVKAQCSTLVETAAVFERTHTRMTDMERDAAKSARALLIAIAYIETLKAGDAAATAELVKMGFDAGKDGLAAQALHDMALADIARCFHEPR